MKRLFVIIILVIVIIFIFSCQLLPCTNVYAYHVFQIPKTATFAIAKSKVISSNLSSSYEGIADRIIKLQFESKGYRIETLENADFTIFLEIKENAYSVGLKKNVSLYLSISVLSKSTQKVSASYIKTIDSDASIESLSYFSSLLTDSINNTINLISTRVVKW